LPRRFYGLSKFSIEIKSGLLGRSKRVLIRADNTVLVAFQYFWFGTPPHKMEEGKLFSRR
jgi:hypothetical protein